MSLVKFLSVFAGCTHQSLEYDPKQHSYTHGGAVSGPANPVKSVPTLPHHTEPAVKVIEILGFCLSQVYVY